MAVNYVSNTGAGCLQIHLPFGYVRRNTFTSMRILLSRCWKSLQCAHHGSLCRIFSCKVFKFIYAKYSANDFTLHTSYLPILVLFFLLVFSICFVEAILLLNSQFRFSLIKCYCSSFIVYYLYDVTHLAFFFSDVSLHRKPTLDMLKIFNLSKF